MIKWPSTESRTFCSAATQSACQHSPNVFAALFQGLISTLASLIVWACLT